MITHHPNCTAAYPEKPAGEAPQAVMTILIDRGEVVRQCSDCGAFEVTAADGSVPVPRQRYLVSVYLGGRLCNFQVHDADEISITTFIREMLDAGYGLDVTLEEA